MTKLSFSFFTALLCIAFLPACGKQESNANSWNGVQSGMGNLSELTERTEYYDITVESTFLSPSEEDLQNMEGYFYTCLDTLLYGETPVQLWAAYRTERLMDLWLYRPDGSWKLLFRDVSIEYAIDCQWYLDLEGNCYCWRNSSRRTYDDGHEEASDTVLTKFLASGEIQFTRKLDFDYYITDFCQLADGRIYLIIRNLPEKTRTLMELDTASGLTVAKDNVELNDSDIGQKLGSGPEAPLLYTRDPYFNLAILAVSPQDGTTSCVFSFTGTSYYFDQPNMNLRDFKMLPDGSILMLYAETDGMSAICNRLAMSKVEKTSVVLRGQFNGDPWITRQASLFNRQSSDYHVVLENCGGGNDVEDFARLTSIQIAAGKGPDILYGNLMQDYITGMLEKDALEDLTPYMEKSGIREEDYFPLVFNVWRDGEPIYTITPRTHGPSGFIMDASILDTAAEPDINSLADSLLSLQDKNVVFLSGYNSQELLYLFLRGSETLWSMVNWEDRHCDFSGELFSKILETAALYGDGENKTNYPSIASSRATGDLFTFDASKDMEKAGKVPCGILFDDGCHLGIPSYNSMAINANSANKDGAWEFLQFLLSEEVQSSDSLYIPLEKKTFDVWLDAQLDEVRDGKEKVVSSFVNVITGGTSTFFAEEHIYTEQDITEEKAAEYRRTLEETRPYPIRILPILAIIQEETADYFNGNKTADEVSKIITNRVQLYLNEMR